MYQTGYKFIYLCVCLSRLKSILRMKCFFIVPIKISKAVSTMAFDFERIKDFPFLKLVLVRVWFVRLYGKIIHERRPYRRTNHILTNLLHMYASAPCTLRDIWS